MHMPLTDSAPIYVVSGGSGTSGKAVVDRALAQFPDHHVPVVVVSNVLDEVELREVVQRVRREGGTIVHTLVDAEVRREMVRLAREQNIVAIDLIGRVLERLSETLEAAPVERPGLYGQLHEAYFRRIEAINFTVAHDDGQRTHELNEADIVIIGVSRVSKTPLSVYLSVQGWKVANVPLLLNQEPPPQLFEVPRAYVVMLTVSPDRLLELREHRGRSQRLFVRMGGYADMDTVRNELDWADLILRRGGFAAVDVTGRSIEEVAQAVIDLVQRRSSKNR
jgi:regulator of PEP synthase PpsR (kinase-PPPase family)